MKMYRVTIDATVTTTLDVSAANAEEAEAKALALFESAPKTYSRMSDVYDATVWREGTIEIEED